MAASAFRYFERIDEEANRFEFWEVSLDGTSLLVRCGPVGTLGKLERESYASETAAAEEHARRIAAQQGDGFHECADRRVDARTRALEDAIATDLDDVDAFLVYADWIQTLGDPRGGLIVAQAAAERDRGAAVRAGEYLAQHAALFLGPLAEHVGYDGALFELGWRYGYIRRARLVSKDAWGARPARVLEQLLDHPSARWLAELVIDLTCEDADLAAVIDVLAARELACLRDLVIGEVGELREGQNPHLLDAGYEDEDDPEIYRFPRPIPRLYLQRLWPALRNVRRLVVRGDPAAFGDIEMPALEHLELHTRGIAAVHARQLETADCPQLQRLDLRYRWPRGTTATELQPIFDGALLRRISQLSITGVTQSDRLAEAFVGVRRASLRELDLSGGDLTDEGARLLAASDLTLDILDVTRNRLTGAGVDELGRIAKLVVAEQQRSRY